MRCGCPDCGAYMVHADGPELGCVCPQCGRHCRDCLGMSAPLTREQLHAMAQQPGAFDGFFGNVESERADQMQRAARYSTGAGNIAGVGRDFRFSQNNVNHSVFLLW